MATPSRPGRICPGPSQVVWRSTSPVYRMIVVAVFKRSPIDGNPVESLAAADHAPDGQERNRKGPWKERSELLFHAYGKSNAQLSRAGKKKRRRIPYNAHGKVTGRGWGVTAYKSILISHRRVKRVTSCGFWSRPLCLPSFLLLFSFFTL